MPARSTFNGHITVYHYRCPAKAGRDIPEAALAQFRLAHNLRNALVEVERHHAEAVAAAWAEHPDVAQALEATEMAAVKVAELEARMKAERSADRTTKPRADTREEIKAARAELKEARVQLKQARADAYATLRPALAAAQSERRAAITRAGQAAKAEGLLWHTHDAVLANHDTAVKAVTAARKAGKPADLRFHRWTGEGRVRVTLMRHEWRHGCGAKKPPWPCGVLAGDCPDRLPGDPVRSPALLAGDGGPWRNVARLAPHMDPAVCETDPPRRHGARETISLRVGVDDAGEPVWWDVPVFVQRPIPADGDITFIEVVRRKIAGNWRLSVSLTVRHPPVAMRTEGHVAALHLGWRHVNGGIRVGTIASTGPLPELPNQPELDGVIRPMPDGRHAEIVVPDGWRDVWAHTSGLQAVRDQMLDSIRRKVVDALNEGVEGIEDRAADVARWRSPSRFAALARAWPADHPLAEALEAWRRQDKHLWEGQAHERDQIVSRRKDAYRKVAAWLLDESVAVLAVHDMPIAELTRTPAVEEGDDRQAVLARAQRQVAAPAGLEVAMRTAASHRGIRVEPVDAAGLTRVHRRCGHELSEATDFAATVMVWCPHCELAYDQDVNAVDHMIARATGEPGPQPVATATTPLGAADDAQD